MKTPVPIAADDDAAADGNNRNDDDDDEDERRCEALFIHMKQDAYIGWLS